VICIKREKKEKRKKEKKSRSMRETFHWNSEISLSYDVLTRGGHTNRKERNKTHKKSSSSLTLSLSLSLFPSSFFFVCCCLVAEDREKVK
jgi:hypothetical protein